MYDDGINLIGILKGYFPVTTAWHATRGACNWSRATNCTPPMPYAHKKATSLPFLSRPDHKEMI